MEQGPERSPLDRCLLAIEGFSLIYGQSVVYDEAGTSFRLARASEEPDASVQLGEVAIQDWSHTKIDTPIMYEVALYSEKGIAQYGVVASLEQVLESLGKVVRYEFTADKTIRRRIFAALANGELEEQPGDELLTDEVAALAEQLVTLRPIQKRLY